MRYKKGFDGHFQVEETLNEDSSGKLRWGGELAGGKRKLGGLLYR